MSVSSILFNIHVYQLFVFPLREQFHSLQNFSQFHLLKYVLQMQMPTAYKCYKYSECNFCVLEFVAFVTNPSAW